jgi:ABC-type nitrate/sulfonate/bicarbonate transport system substrate-binding protein
MVALMGGVKNLKDLKGKSISILGYQDSTYYVLLAALASVNLSKEDVSIQALGPSGVVQEFIRAMSRCAHAFQTGSLPPKMPAQRWI